MIEAENATAAHSTIAPARFNFTKATLLAVQCPGHLDRIYVYDVTAPGLAFCVTATGRRSFYFYKWNKVKRRPDRERIGGFPDITIEQARDEVSKLNGDIAKGLDPAAKRQKANAEWTLDDLFTHYLKTHAKLHKKSWQQDQDQFDRYLENWKTKKLSNINRQDIQAIHAKVGSGHGTYSANRVLALLSKMYSVAGESGWTGGNPAMGVQRFKEKSRERFLHVDEMPAFFKSLDAEPNETLRDFFLVTLLTGARRSNTAAMRWDQLQIERGTWTIPDTKNGLPLVVPLVPHVVTLLEKRKGMVIGESPFVFPGYGKTGHLAEPKMAWKRLLERANIKDLRIHDLRRTLGSWMAAAGTSLPIIGKTLGHKSAATTQIYARLDLTPVIASIGVAAGLLLAAKEPPVLPPATEKKPAKGKAKKATA